MQRVSELPLHGYFGGYAYLECPAIHVAEGLCIHPGCQ
jgi:hypothetical protein